MKRIPIDGSRMSRHVGGSIQQNLRHIYYCIATLNGASVGGLSPTLSMQYSPIQHQLYRRRLVDSTVISIAIAIAIADDIVLVVGRTPVMVCDKDAL